MSTLIERLRSRTVVDDGNGLPELLEEAAREIQRLSVALVETEQKLDSMTPYSSSGWPDDA